MYNPYDLEDDYLEFLIQREEDISQEEDTDWIYSTKEFDNNIIVYSKAYLSYPDEYQNSPDWLFLKERIYQYNDTNYKFGIFIRTRQNL